MTTEYQLYLGDCLDTLEQLPSNSVDGVVTDPPYCSGGRQQQQARSQITKNGSRSDDEWFTGDNMGTDSYVRFMRQIARESIRVCRPNSVAYVFTDWRQYTNLVTAWESVGWTLKNVIIWDKNRGGAMGSFWRNNHEWICVFAYGKPGRIGGSFFNTWRGSKPQGGLHPTIKPVPLMEYIVSAFGEGKTLLDPFMGSGTTGVAAIKQNCSFIGIEQTRPYYELAQERIKTAVLEREDGRLLAV